MTESLAIVPVRGGELSAGDLETVAEVGSRTVLIGSTLGPAVAQLAGIVPGVDCVEVESIDILPCAAALAPLVAEHSFVVLPGSPDGRDLGAVLSRELAWPHFAPVLSVRFTGTAADSVEVDLVRFGGYATSVLSPAEPFVAVMQTGAGAVERGDGETVLARSLDLGMVGDAPRAEVLELIPADPITMELGEAHRIVGIGAGLLESDDPETSRRRVETVVGIGECFGASMGATRVVTDAGFVDHGRQIGTTGVVVDPDLYIGLAISGAVQHTAGLGNPRHVISVNTDPHCPMMTMADVAIVADAREVVEHLQRLLGEEP